jgi:hypothetical protein
MEMKISEETLEEMFNDLLNEGEEVRIGSLTYLPSQVLKATDPIAYRTGLADYADSLSKDGYEVEGYN